MLNIWIFIEPLPVKFQALFYYQYLVSETQSWIEFLKLNYLFKKICSFKNYFLYAIAMEKPLK